MPANTPIKSVMNPVILFLIKKSEVVEKWKMLARELDLEENIHSIEYRIHKNMDGEQEAISYLITTWKGKKSTEATIGVLCTALKEINCCDVAEELEQRF